MDWNLNEAVAYYKKMGAPKDQTALISLLREVQRENGDKIPVFMLASIAQSYGIKENLLLALIRRIPSLRLDNAYCLELCSGPNCGKHIALAACAEEFHTESGKKFSLKYVPCMRMCGKGPNLKWNGKIYNNADKLLLEKLLREAGIKS